DRRQQGGGLVDARRRVGQVVAGSHARKGWEAITAALLAAVARGPQRKVFLLWGNHSNRQQALIEAAGGQCKVLRANHPSALSALRPPRPFIGCGHFSQANAWLSTQGVTPIDWVG